MKITKKDINCILIIALFIAVFPPSIINVSGNTEKEPTIFGELTDIPENQEQKFIYFRDLILNELNVSLETYYSYDENNTQLAHKYIYALMGYENGTLTKDEVETMTKHNTPITWWGLLLWPLQGDFLSRTDQEFRFQFFSRAGVALGERIKQVDAYLDEDSGLLSPFNEYAPTVIHLNLVETHDPWNFGYVSGKSWIAPGADGGIWGVDGVGFQAYGLPGYLDNYVKVVLKYKWQTWSLFEGWQYQDPSYMKINRMDLPFIGPPISIDDDDTTPPCMAAEGQMPNINFHSLTLDLGGGITQVILEDDNINLGGLNLDNIQLKYWIWDATDVELRYKVNGVYTDWITGGPISHIVHSLSSLLTSPYIKTFYFTIEVRDKDNDRPDDSLSSEISFSFNKDVPYTRPILSDKVRIQMKAHNVMDLYQGIDFSQYPDPDLFVAYKDENNNKGWFEPLISVINPKDDRPIRITIKYTTKILLNRLIMDIKALGWTVTTDPNLSHVKYFTKELSAGQVLNEIAFFRTTITNTRVLKDTWEYITQDVFDYAAFALEGFIMKEWPWSKGLTITSIQKKSAYAVGFIDFGKDIYRFISGLLALDNTNCPIHQFELQMYEVVIPKFKNPDGTWNWTDTDILNRDILNQNLDLAGLAQLNGMMTWADKAPDDNKFSFTALFIPTQDQIAWAIAFLTTELINDGLMFGSTIAFKEGYWKAGVWLFVFSVVADIVKYGFHLMANDIDPPNLNYNEKSIPEKLELNPDIKQQLIDSGDEDIVELVDTLYELEKNFYGHQQSYDKYVTALNNSNKEAAANQLKWGIGYLEEANDLLPNLGKELSRGLSKFVDTMNQLDVGFDVNDAPDMSNFVLNETAKEIIEYHKEDRPEWNVQTPEEYENNYRQLNGSSWELEEKIMKSTIILKNLLEQVIDETTNDFTAKYVNLQKELGNSIIDKPDIRNELDAKLLSAEVAFRNGEYSLCIEISTELEESSRYWYLETLDPFFDEINWKANSLKIMALSINQLHINPVGDIAKEVKNGESIEFEFEVYNELNNHIDPNNNEPTVNPTIEIRSTSSNGLIPEGINFFILDENDNLLPIINGFPTISLENKEVKNIKIKVDITENSPYELQDLTFTLLIRQEFGGVKTIQVEHNFSIFILDDDASIPEITIDYTGDGTDGNSGIWNVNVTDTESGLDEIQVFVDGFEIVHDQNLNGIISKSYEIIAPNSLAIHEIEVIGKNNDYDWIDDQEISYQKEIILIIDDDTSPPIINIGYSGLGTDGNPGCFSWIITDTDDGIGGDHDLGLSEIFIKVNYESTQNLPNEEYILNSIEIGTWNLPSNLGIYTITIFARDNDDDRNLITDSLSIELTNNQEIIDDDILPPIISNLVISDNPNKINISFNALDDGTGDDEGIGEINIYIDGNFIKTIYPNPLVTSFEIIINNDWIMEIGTHQVTIEVWDGDDDRLDDSLLTVVSGTFEIALDEMYQYVIWQIEELKDYIDSNIDSCFKYHINCKLSKSQHYLQQAITHIEDGEITSGLINDFISKIHLKIAEIKTLISEKVGWISTEHAEYIVYNLHNIRNNIVILMGTSVGTETGYNIALIEVDLLNLMDFIDVEIEWCTGRSLSNLIRCATMKLELAIFVISMDIDPECLLKQAQWKLEKAEYKVNWLSKRGKITQELADILLLKINKAYTDIEFLRNSL